MRERIHLTAAKCNFTCTIYIPGSSSYDWHDSTVRGGCYLFFFFFTQTHNKRQLSLTDIVAVWSKMFYNSLSISCDCSWQQRESKFPFRSCKCLEKFITILPLLVEVFHIWPKLWTDSLFHPRCHAAIVADFMVLFTLSTPCWFRVNTLTNVPKISTRPWMFSRGKQLLFTPTIWCGQLCQTDVQQKRKSLQTWETNTTFCLDLK